MKPTPGQAQQATPLLGCTALHSLDWRHAWALLGGWANFMVFPLPTKRRDNGRSLQWPRHGHTGKLRTEMQKRTPSLVGWARPAFEQGALPPLSLLPAQCPVCVLPGDKLFQSDTLHEHFMNPVIFHGFSGNKDKCGKELEKAGKKGMMPMVACLLGTEDFPLYGSIQEVALLWSARNGQLGRDEAASHGFSLMPSFKHGGRALCFLWRRSSKQIRIQLLVCQAWRTRKLCPRMSLRGCL